jgi:hypothetical protein
MDAVGNNDCRRVIIFSYPVRGFSNVALASKISKTDRLENKILINNVPGSVTIGSFPEQSPSSEFQRRGRWKIGGEFDTFTLTLLSPKWFQLHRPP